MSNAVGANRGDPPTGGIGSSDPFGSPAAARGRGRPGEDVTDLETSWERARLYAVDAADEGDRAGALTVCPCKGLAAFEAAEADYYFGRERLVAELVARSLGSTFLGLVDDSGSGKSSALLAG